MGLKSTKSAEANRTDLPIVVIGPTMTVQCSMTRNMAQPTSCALGTGHVKWTSRKYEPKMNADLYQDTAII